MAAALLAAISATPVVAGAAPARDDINQIIVTALPLTQRLEDVAQPTEVLAGDELRQRIEASIGETLARLPGTNSSYFGPAASRPIIRGLGGERLQVLEDGLGSLDVSALSPDHAVTIESLLAEQVEVLRGPATLLYGNGTVGGVVNVVTSRIPATPREAPWQGVAELRGNSALDERAGTARVDATLGNVGLHVDGFTRDTNDVEIDSFAWSDAIRAQFAADGLPVDETKGRVPNSDTDSQGVGLGASWFLDNGFAGLGYNRFESNYGVPGPAIDMEQDRYDFASEIRDTLPGFGTLRMRATVNDYLHREIEPSGEVGTTFDQRALEARVSADHAPVAGWAGAVGLQYRDTDLEATGEEAFVPPSDTSNAGLFLFEELPTGSLTWQAGLRIENQDIDVDGAQPDYDDTSVNASAGLVWDFDAAYSLALNLTRAERHPAATELYADGPHLAVARFEVGDPNLDPETALTGDLTLRRTAGDLRFAVTAFVNQFSDFIYAANTGAIEDELPVYEYRQQDATFAGFEGELEFPLGALADGSLSGRLLADYVRGRFRDGAGG
jgi:iron complex outermembrane receptor protein